MTRREFLTTSGAIAAYMLYSTKGFAMFGLNKKKDIDANFPYSLSEEEWKKKLTEQEYDVLRDHGTERAFTSPLNEEKRQGIYSCAGCGQEVYSSDAKFNSGTGWPSFYQPIDGVSGQAVGEREDNTLWMKRTEAHCANCGGHLGHVFPDGPKPTGLRYCMNGVAMDFEPTA